jgi:hypothetical protein
MLGIRCDAEDISRLDKIVDGMLLGSRHAVARAALRIGLSAIEANPAVLVGANLTKRKGLA